LTLPKIEDIRKFFYFLDSIIKNMLSIQNNFSCFKLKLTGKSRGGTKRTSVLSIGYGVLPIHSISINILNAFIPYRHEYGAFGLKLLMNRTLKKIKQKR
jgi:hypothetical protein